MKNIGTEPSANVSKYLSLVRSSSFFNTFISASSSILLLPSLVRIVGLSNYGAISSVSVFILVASVFDFGLAKTIVWKINRCRSREEENDAFLSIGFLYLASAFISVLIFSYAVTNVRNFVPSYIYTRGYRFSVFYLSSGYAIVLLQVFATAARGILEAKMKSHLVNFGFGAFTAIYYSALLTSALLTDDVAILLFVCVAVYFCSFIANIFLAFKYFPISFGFPSSKGLSSTFDYAYRSFIFDLPSILFSLLPISLAQSGLKKGDSYGALDLAFKISILLASAVSGLSTPLSAIVAGRVKTKVTARRLCEIIDQQIAYSIGASIIFFLLFVIFGKFALDYLGRQNSQVIFYYSRIILPGALLLASMEPVARAALGLNRLWSVIGCRFIGIAVFYLVWLSPISTEIGMKLGIALSVGYITSAALLFLGYPLLKSRFPDL